jgi:type III restriction enzyme
LDYLNPRHIIRVSATPSSGVNREYYEIPEDEVIGSGLITKAIYINMDFKADDVIDDENLYLLDMADRKRKEIDSEYKKLGKISDH